MENVQNVTNTAYNVNADGTINWDATLANYGISTRKLLKTKIKK